MRISMKEAFVYKSPYAEELQEYMEYRALTLAKSTVQAETRFTENFDRYLSGRIESRIPLSRDLTEEWAARSPWEKAVTQKKRIDYTKRLFSFLSKKGICAELPPVTLRNAQSDYIPYIYTKEELRRIFSEADHYAPTWGSPYLHLTVPIAFRILYGCGLRSSELTGLRVKDVDFGIKSLCIWDSKFHKSRYVPFSSSLGTRMKDYIALRYPDSSGNEYLIARPTGERYHTSTVHHWHMTLLYKAGIPHGGKGYGPRVHDYRHTFAVHSLQKSIQEGHDMMAVLPALSSYLGHKDLRGTQYYLHLTAELYPHILEMLTRAYGKLLEGGGEDEA